MWRGNTLFGVTLLVAGGVGVAGATASAGQAQSQRPANNAAASASSASAGDLTIARQHAQNRVKGVQSLFAQATDAALTRDGLPQLAALFAPQSALAGPTTAPSTPIRIEEPTKPIPATNPAGAADDVVALNRAIDQLNREWRQKYGRDVRIADPPLVFADITANDIVVGAAQVASGKLRGAFNESPGTKGNPTSPNSAPGGPTPNSNGAPDRPLPAGSDSLTATETVGRQLTVVAPPVIGSPPVSVNLIAVGATSYKFANSSDIVERHRLSAALETHIKELINEKDRWPADASQAQRFATQHILMAISEVGSASAAKSAG